MIKVIREHEGIILSGDFNAFNMSWGSRVDRSRGKFLLDKLDFLMNLNDGTATRIPSNCQVSNPLDLTWISTDIFDDFSWRVDFENLGSDHLVIRMELQSAMQTEKVKLREKIDRADFQRKLPFLDTENIATLDQFIKAVNEIKVTSRTKGDRILNPRYVPKSFWNERVKTAYKKFALIAYYRNMTAENLTNFNRYNAILKRTIKEEKKLSWRSWADNLNPNAP